MDAIRLTDLFPKSAASRIFTNQLIRSASSVAANFRAACRARSTAECIAKLGIVEEEADESVFWIEMAMETGLINEEEAQALLKEGNEIVAIVVTSIVNMKRREKSQ